jgi:cytochrome c oxidase subunit II
MDAGFSLFPPQASSVAGRVDLLFFFMVAVSVFFFGLIAGLIAFFSVKYRRRGGETKARTYREDMRLEILWIAVPSGISLVMFFWGAFLYLDMFRPPPNALDMYVVGKQWMWKVQHPQGPREINELHVPLGQAVRLILSSDDVIHSFFVPAFRTKMDAVPGRYTSLWFRATRQGVYHLFCAEYCGTEHARMVGRVVVMKPSDYEAWLGRRGTGRPPMAAGGETLFRNLGCATCHPAGAAAGPGLRGPSLAGLFGKGVLLQSGRTVRADENYIRESILVPGRQVVAGFQSIMPSYEGQIKEDDLAQLVAYIKSLGKPEEP